MVFALIGLLSLFADSPAAKPPAPKPRLICRRDEVETGSHQHTGARCLTQEQWQQEDARYTDPATLRLSGQQVDGQAGRPPH